MRGDRGVNQIPNGRRGHSSHVWSLMVNDGLTVLNTSVSSVTHTLTLPLHMFNYACVCVLLCRGVFLFF